MNRKKIIWILIILVIIAGGLYAYKEFTRTHPDLTQVKPHFTKKAIDLVGEFEQDDSSAGTKYIGKIIEVEGILRSKEADANGFFTMILGNESNLSSVRCLLDSTYNSRADTWTAGDHLTIRGVCTGFNKDELGLGSDIILNRSVIISKK